MIQIKTPSQIEGIRKASKIVALAHQQVLERLKEGMTTYQIDNVVKHTLRDNGAKSAFLKYRQGNKPPFPAYSCISVNEEIVHGIGSHDKVLQEGDVITVDVGAIKDGFFGDAALTTIVGKGSKEDNDLVIDTRDCLMMAIDMAKPGVMLHDISEAIYTFAKERDYGIVINYFGHGVGLKLHEPPHIPNYRPKPGDLGAGINVQLQPGMTITFEPMFTLGSGTTEELEDQWTVVTKDRSKAAHWEHTILITEDGTEILTVL